MEKKLNNDKRYMHFKAFNFLALIYVTIMLITVAVAYKIVKLGDVVIVSSTLVLPAWYVLSDVIAEVYGYKISRQLIWLGLSCVFVFIFSCVFLIHLPSPSYWYYQADYEFVFDRLPRVFIGSFFGLLTGSFLNIYILTKWKILTRGKYFWLRSAVSSSIGEAVFTVITITANYIGVFQLSHVMELMAVSYIFKIITSIISVIPASVLASYLKKLEGIDVYDYNTNFNPFKIAI